MNAHPIELRRRIVNYSLSHSVRNTAKIFSVSPDTVQRLKQLFTRLATWRQDPATPNTHTRYRPKGNCMCRHSWWNHPT